MCGLEKKIGKVFTSKFVGTGLSSYKKRIYRAAVSQKLRNTTLHSAEKSFGGGARHLNVSRPLCNKRIFCETKTVTLRYKQYFLQKKRRSFRMSHKYAVNVFFFSWRYNPRLGLYFTVL